MMKNLRFIKGCQLAWMIAKKDLLIEWRRKELILTSTFFSILVVMVCIFGFYVRPELASQILSGVLWLPILFSGIVIMGRSWAMEKEHGNLNGLLMSPVPTWSIYAGKALSTWVLLTIVEVMLLITVWFLFPAAEMFHLPFIGLIVFLGTLGFVFAGTLFSSLSAKTQHQDFVLSTILFPLLSPTLLLSVVATKTIFHQTNLAEIGNVVWEFSRMLVVFDLIYLVAATSLFEFVIRER